MAKLYFRDCCRVDIPSDEIVVEVSEGHHWKQSLQVPCSVLLEAYETYRTLHPRALASSELDWTLRFLKPQALEADSVKFSILQDVVEITSNQTCTRECTIEVRGVAKDSSKYLWFIGTGNSHIALTGTGGKDFYKVFTDLKKESGKLFEVSLGGHEDGVAKINLNQDVVGNLTKTATKSGELNNERQVLATAMAFQPLFVEMLLSGTGEQLELLEKWLKGMHNSEVNNFLELSNWSEGQTAEQDRIKDIVGFAHLLTRFALNDFVVPSSRNKGKDYFSWLRENNKEIDLI